MRPKTSTDMQRIKTPKQIERHMKGLANHYRIQMLLLIANEENITFDNIVSAIGGNEKTLGEHCRRLYIAGLIDKTHRGRFVQHRLSPYGKKFIKFLKSFQHI